MRIGDVPAPGNRPKSLQQWALAASIALLIMAVAESPSSGQGVPETPPAVLSDYVLKEVEFRGRLNLELKEIEEKTGLKKGVRTDMFRVVESLDKIRTLYRTKGYEQAEVKIVEGSNLGDPRLVIEIIEGTKGAPWPDLDSAFPSFEPARGDSAVKSAGLFDRETKLSQEMRKDSPSKTKATSGVESGPRPSMLPTPFPSPGSGLNGTLPRPVQIVLDPVRNQEYQAHVERAKQAVGMKNWKTATSEATAAIKLFPESSEPYRFRGEIYDSMDLHRKAIDDLTEAVRLWPGLPQYYLARGFYYFEDWDFEHGSADFDKAFELSMTEVDRANAHYWRGSAQMHRGDFALAVADFDRAIELGASSSSLFGARGQALVKLGRYDPALADLDRSLAIEPDATTWFLRGECHYAQRLYAAARTDYDRAIEADPKISSYRTSRGWARLALGEVDEAIEDFDKALKLNPRCYAAFNGRGWANLAKNNLDRAVADFEKFLSLQRPDYGFGSFCFARDISMIPIFERAGCEFLKRQKAHPNLRFALVLFAGEEAQTNYLERPYFRSYLVCRLRLDSNPAPNLIFHLEANWRTIPELKSALLGRAIAAIRQSDWKEALDDLDYALRQVVECQFPDWTRPSLDDFLLGH